MSSPPGDVLGFEGVEDRGSHGERAEKLRDLAPKLIGLEVWCHQRGLSDIAQHLSAVVDVIDHEMTQSGRDHSALP